MLYEILEPWRGRANSSVVSINGLVTESLAGLALTARDYDRAERDATEALEQAARVGARVSATRTRLVQARLLAARRSWRCAPRSTIRRGRSSGDRHGRGRASDRWARRKPRIGVGALDVSDHDGQATAVSIIARLRSWGAPWYAALFFGARHIERVTAPMRSQQFIHFCHWMVLSSIPGQDGTSKRLPRPILWFESNYDGDVVRYMDTFARVIPWRMPRGVDADRGLPRCVPARAVPSVDDGQRLRDDALLVGVSGGDDPRRRPRAPGAQGVRRTARARSGDHARRVRARVGRFPRQRAG